MPVRPATAVAACSDVRPDSSYAGRAAPPPRQPGCRRFALRALLDALQQHYGSAPKSSRRLRHWPGTTTRSEPCTGARADLPPSRARVPAGRSGRGRHETACSAIRRSRAARGHSRVCNRPVDRVVAAGHTARCRGPGSGRRSSRRRRKSHPATRRHLRRRCRVWLEPQGRRSSRPILRHADPARPARQRGHANRADTARRSPRRRLRSRRAPSPTSTTASISLRRPRCFRTASTSTGSTSWSCSGCRSPPRSSSRPPPASAGHTPGWSSSSTRSGASVTRPCSAPFLPSSSMPTDSSIPSRSQPRAAGSWSSRSPVSSRLGCTASMNRRRSQRASAN